MCGFVFIHDKKDFTQEQIIDSFEKIKYRGPDGSTVSFLRKYILGIS
jgi:asparagine synthetase B (glutamine-hydrolysing)